MRLIYVYHFSILSNPEVLRHLQTLQNTILQPHAEMDVEKLRKLQEMKQQEDEFDKHLAQTVPVCVAVGIFCLNKKRVWFAELAFRFGVRIQVKLKLTEHLAELFLTVDRYVSTSAGLQNCSIGLRYATISRGCNYWVRGWICWSTSWWCRGCFWLQNIDLNVTLRKQFMCIFFHCLGNWTMCW